MLSPVIEMKKKNPSWAPLRNRCHWIRTRPEYAYLLCTAAYGFNKVRASQIPLTAYVQTHARRKTAAA